MALAGFASEARASDFTDFQAARAPYESGDYAAAVIAFEELVGGEVPRLTDPNIIQESRKYLGAAYIFEDREADAITQFEQIVRADENQLMAAATFTRPVVDVFDRVRQRVRQEIADEAEAARIAEDEARQAELARIVADRDRLERILALARTSEVREENSRVLASIPFGVGQFQNENTGLGAFFLSAEVALAAGSIITYIYWATIVDRAATAGTVDVDSFTTQETALRISNQTLFALFGATVIAGIIEAHINFRPERVRTQERELPDDLRPQTDPEIDVGLSPFGASMRVTF